MPPIGGKNWRHMPPVGGKAGGKNMANMAHIWQIWQNIWQIWQNYGKYDKIMANMTKIMVLYKSGWVKVGVIVGVRCKVGVLKWC